jgi:hypothetical protein
MKRDMDLARKILLAVEARRLQELRSEDLVTEGYESRTVAAHFELLQEAGLIDASLLRVESEGLIRGDALRLTWEGHEYLDTIRSNEIWEKTKTHVTKQGGSLSFELIKAVALGYLRAQLGLPG